MTAIVGIKEGKKIILASDGTSVSGNDKDPIGNHKVIRPTGSPDILLAYTGTRALINALQAERGFFGKGKELTFVKMVNVIVPKLFEFCQKRHFTRKDSDGYLTIAGGFLFATSEFLYYIDSYGGVFSIDGFCAFGIGSSVAMASLYATADRGISPEERAIRAVQAAIKHVPGLGYPIYFGLNDQKRVKCFDDWPTTSEFLTELAKKETEGVQ
jgi:ATP-dependent protease HslVU (ClpYQ) peptidase subunit